MKKPHSTLSHYFLPTLFILPWAGGCGWIFPYTLAEIASPHIVLSSLAASPPAATIPMKVAYVFCYHHPFPLSLALGKTRRLWHLGLSSLFVLSPGICLGEAARGPTRGRRPSSSCDADRVPPHKLWSGRVRRVRRVRPLLVVWSSSSTHGQLHNE